jgi:predicted ferric reductase
MTDHATLPSPTPRLAPGQVRPHGSGARVILGSTLPVVAAINAGVIVWLWVEGGGVEFPSWGEGWATASRLTGLLGAYLALLQVVLLARLPWLERMVGFDRLTRWHRWNGHATLWLVLIHVVTIVIGYAGLDRLGIWEEIKTLYTSYPGMLTASIGTALYILVVVTSIVIVRARLRYEWWNGVHITIYAGIALAWFHQVPTGNEFIHREAATWYWRSLHLAVLALLVVFRLLVPIVNAFRYRLRVVEVVAEAPGVTTVRIAGPGLARLRANAGQFFLWRFLTRGHWWSSHPFSLSQAPDGQSLRITVRGLGDFTRAISRIAPGTRVVTEGPFGVFTQAVRRREKVLLVAGGIGITPVRALVDVLEGDVVLIYRSIDEAGLVFRDELDRIARARGIRVEYVVGDHATEAGSQLLSATHLRELVPDLAERDVYVCGPPAMTDAIAASARAAGVARRFLHTERFSL